MLLFKINKFWNLEKLFKITLIFLFFDNHFWTYFLLKSNFENKMLFMFLFL